MAFDKNRMKPFLGKRILIVDDDFFMRDIYQKKLGNVGFEVDTAGDGLAGIDRIRKKKPDLVLLDIFMPYLDGKEMLYEMRQHEEWKHIPVIMLTNLSEYSGVLNGFELGADEYLIKSHFTPSEVFEKIVIVFERVAKNDTMNISEQETANSEKQNSGSSRS